MTPRIHSVITSGALALAVWFSPLAAAQDAAPAAGSVQEELRALRQLIEQQSRQIDALTAQITRLGGELERRNMATPNAALPATVPRDSADDDDHATPPAPRVVAPAGNVHIIVKGDSLDKLAKQYKTTIAELQKLNKITDPKRLQIGQQIILPPNAATNAERKEEQ